MLRISKSLGTEDIALHRDPLQSPVLPFSDVDPDMDRKSFFWSPSLAAPVSSFPLDSTSMRKFKLSE